MRATPRQVFWIGALMGLGWLAGGIPEARASAAPDHPGGAASRIRLAEAYGRRPLAFEENRGQTDGRVRFLARGDGYGLFLTSTEAVLVLRGSGPARVLRLRWQGASPTPGLSGSAELPGRSHYLRGSDSSRWRTEIPSFERVWYRDVYPGIDLVFYGSQRQLEHDFVLAPGADPRAIRLAVEGADRVEIDPAGDLVLALEDREVRLKKPVAYQEVGAERREVRSGYRLLPAADGSLRVGFEVGRYDPAQSLVIDPILAYSTYLGGSNNDQGVAIAADAAGNAYVTGLTESPDFPLANALSTTLTGAEAFVTKLDPSGALVFSTYLGGSRSETGAGIAVDAATNVYVTGITSSLDFPLVNPLPVPIDQLQGDVFVAKLAPGGSALVYSTRLGGSGSEFGSAIAVDPQGHAYVTGWTNSSDFPTVHPLSLARGSADAFVAKLHPSGSSLVYSTYLGGTGGDLGDSVAVDGAGRAYITGITYSTDFPTVHAIQGPARYSNAFVASLHPSGTALVYSTYLGGNGDDWGTDIAVDPAGNAYIAGNTNSEDFPTLHAARSFLKGGHDLFAVKLSPAGSLAYSTYLGGDWLDSAGGIAVDAAGNAYLTGVSETTQDPLDSFDILFVKLHSSGAMIVDSLLIGSENGFEEGRDIALDSFGNAYLTGITDAGDFPIVNAMQPAYGGSLDAFVIKLASNRPPDCSAAFASPARLWPPNGNLVPVSIRGVTNPDGDPVTLAVTAVRQDEPLTRRGSPDATGLGSATARLRASRQGGRDGRVYHLAFEANDGQGGTCTGRVTVCVPHDQRPGAACGDGGPIFDSAR
ncbi:MAG TPA: SBBP repeat-containing protein [Thermoanaerobaculia bacterium]